MSSLIQAMNLVKQLVNKFFLAVDKIIPETELRQRRLKYSHWKTISENKGTIKQFKEKRDSRHIYQNELDKLAFRMTWLIELLKIYLDAQLLIKYVLRDKAFIQKMIAI